jgi:alpha/beta superfamily hydrolase
VLRRIGRWLALFVGLSAVVAVIATAWAVREFHRDPMPLLDHGIAALRVVSSHSLPLTTAAGEARTVLEIELAGAAPDSVRIAVSLPAQPHARHLPVLIILGGLEVGRDSLRYVGTHGENALVAVQYPRSATYWYEGTPLRKLPAIRSAALAMPARIASLAAWLRAQPWADPDRVSLLGYSFGAFFVPACARVARADGQAFSFLVMAYGGADLARVFDANVRLRPRALQWTAGRLLAAVVRPLEPALHLPLLPEEALFVTGLRDRKVPLASARRMQQLKPEPKTVIDLDTAHMDPKDPALTRQIVETTRAWLVARGAIAPPAP